MIEPGVILKKMLKDSGMTNKELATRTGVTEKHISTILNGERKISPTFARKLGYVFKDTKFWLNVQAEYDSEQLKIKEENEISDEEILILGNLKNIINYFIQKGWIHNNCGEPSKVMQLRKFLNVSDLLSIPNITYNAAYRAQIRTNIKVDPYVLFAWQRLCEKETENISVSKELNIEILKENIPKIKNLMFEDINTGIKKLTKIFAQCGIKFKVVKNFRGAPVQGFIKKISKNQLVLCLTLRGKRADRFWFTLFHEIAHILNNDYKNRFVDFDSGNNEIEIKADTVARNLLINPISYKNFIHSNEIITWSNIEEFSKKNNIRPFILLGRLQNDQILDWSDFSDKIVNYEWGED